MWIPFFKRLSHYLKNEKEKEMLLLKNVWFI